VGSQLGDRRQRSLSGSSSDSEVELAAVDCDGCTRSILLPARAITMFGLACCYSSFTHVLAFSRVEAFVMSYTTTAACALQ
jgi:hypothetical protein